MTAECEVYLAEEGQLPLAKPFLSMPATEATVRTLRLRRHPICGLETVPLLTGPSGRNEKLDGFRGTDFAFVKVGEAAAKKLGRRPGWYPVDIDIVKKLKAKQAR